jgi:hypothetical protein
MPCYTIIILLLQQKDKLGLRTKQKNEEINLKTIFASCLKPTINANNEFF